MSFEFNWATGQITGGWNSVDNVVNSAGSQGSSIYGNLAVPIQSNIMAPTNQISGLARTVEPQANSFLGAMSDWASNEWINTPMDQPVASPLPTLANYAANSSGFLDSGLDNAAQAAQVDQSAWYKPWTNAFSNVFGGAAKAINDQLPNLLLQKIGLIPKTQQVNSQGATETNYYASGAQQPVQAATPQQPGLFNIGFPSGAMQTAGAAGMNLSTLLIVGLGIGVLVMLLRKR